MANDTAPRRDGDAAARIAQIAADHLRGDILLADLPKALRELAGEIESMLGAFALEPPAASVRAEEEARAITLVFRRWRDRTGHTRSRLTPERSRAVRARLRQGYQVAQILRAVEGCAASEFHAGRYDDLTLICRTGSNIERFAAMAPDKSKGEDAPDDEVARLRKRLRDAAERGDADEYATINGQLRAAVQRPGS